jgi:hypothetical protein
MANYDNLSAAVIDSNNLETEMMNQSFFNNDDNIVRKMKQKFSKDIAKLPYKQRMELKECGEEITAGYKMTKSFSVITATDHITPKQYIYSMMKEGWEGWNLLAVSPYLSYELEEAVLKYFVAPKNILK